MDIYIYMLYIYYIYTYIIFSTTFSVSTTPAPSLVLKIVFRTKSNMLILAKVTTF